jgi:cytochrome b subunit of formate dehydrogenase
MMSKKKITRMAHQLSSKALIITIISFFSLFFCSSIPPPHLDTTQKLKLNIHPFASIVMFVKKVKEWRAK